VTDRHGPQLALQLAPALEPLPIQLAGRERREHGAARLARVRAVVEPALGSELLDVGERRIQRFPADVPELQLAEAGSVDHDSAAGKEDQLAPRGRVPTLVVVCTRLVRREQLFARPAVHERRLPDAGGAEQHSGRPRLEPRSQSVASLTREGRDDVNWHAWRNRLDLGDERPGVIQPVCLCQDDLGRGAGLPDRYEIALDPARLEIRAEGGDDERDVDIRGERLGRRREAGRIADDRTPARQHRLDDGAIGDGDPVADGDVGALVPEPAGNADSKLAALRVHDVLPAMLDGDAGGQLVRFERFGELRPEAELAQIERGQRSSPSSWDTEHGGTAAARPRRSAPSRRLVGREGREGGAHSHLNSLLSPGTGTRARVAPAGLVVNRSSDRTGSRGVAKHDKVS
jgi:hypothetical protein